MSQTTPWLVIPSAVELGAGLRHELVLPLRDDDSGAALARCSAMPLPMPFPTR